MSIRSKLPGELAALLELFLPPACPLCGEALRTFPPTELCPSCLEGIHPLSTPCCPCCSLPYPTEGGDDHRCETCLREPPRFAWVKGLGIYEGSLREAVHRFKFEGAVGLDLPLAKLLSTATEEAVKVFAPDLITAVPLHRERLRERTYNQSLLLARRLTKIWNLPLEPQLLVRSRPTPPQQGLQAEIRRRNLRGAFCSRALDGERVLLVDDVLTTGATAREATGALLDAGAAAVAVVVLGRAARH